MSIYTLLLLIFLAWIIWRVWRFFSGIGKEARERMNEFEEQMRESEAGGYRPGEKDISSRARVIEEKKPSEYE